MHSIDQTLLWLCGIDSPIGEEKQICDAIVARLARVSLPAPIRRYGNSIVVPLVRLGGTGPREHIALAGHLDTVRTENGPARIEGDRCFGAGASDMKSGLAIMLELAEHPLAHVSSDLTLVFYAGEEGPYAENELGPVLEQDPELRDVSFAVCMEPSDNKIHLGCMGSIHATLTFSGKTAHSARPWEGENAVTKSASFLAEIASVEPAVHVLEGFTYRSVMTITRASDGGRGRNIVPDRFHLNLNHRFNPSVSAEQAKKNISDFVAGRAEIEFTDVSPSAQLHAHHPLVQALRAAGARTVEPKQAWTDVARFSALGIPAINFGPGENAQAHQKNESTSLALVREGDEITRRWLESIARI